MESPKTTARQDEKYLSVGIWCDLYKRFVINHLLTYENYFASPCASLYQQMEMYESIIKYWAAWLLLMPWSCNLHILRVAWWHQAITQTNLDLSSVKSWGIHIRAISLEMLKIYIIDMCLKIIYLKLHPHLPGINGLTSCLCVMESGSVSIICRFSMLDPGVNITQEWNWAGQDHTYMADGLH